MLYWTLPQRQQHVSQLRSTGTPEGTQSLFFQHHLQNLPIFRIPIELPCYRLANGRTRALQAEWIATHALSSDFFEVDPDSEPALNVQHQLLKRLVNEKNLKNVLSKQEQTDPFVLDENGYVVNGNRRLCAMRELLDENSEGASNFRHVRIVILPTCTSQDVRELEARLQVYPDTRADYTWVDLAMMQRSLRRDGMEDEQLAELYNMKISEVQQLVRMLEQAESYLAERGLTGQYSKVYKQGKYAFRQLLKCRQSLGGEPERDVFTNLSYLLIDDPEGGRLYESIPELNQNLSGIIGRIRTELNPGGGNLAALVPNPNTTVELFGSTGQAHANYADILEVLRDSNQRDRVRTVVQDALEEIDRREREKRDAEYCLRQVVHAHTDLQAAFNALDETTQTAGMDSQLGNIEILLNRIREWLRSRDNT